MTPARSRLAAPPVGRVLVVSDDDADASRLGALSAARSSAPPSFHHAPSSTAALSCLVERDYDAVVLGRRVNGANGLDLLDGRLFLAFETPVIFLGEQEDGEEAAAARRAGAAEVLTRERLTPERLEEALRYARVLKARDGKRRPVEGVVPSPCAAGALLAAQANGPA